MLKRFFFASAAVLMLALAHYFGAPSATAQSGGGIVAFAPQGVYPSNDNATALTASGDVHGLDGATFQWAYRGNVLSGSVQVEQRSWGQVKAGFRSER